MTPQVQQMRASANSVPSMFRAFMKHALPLLLQCVRRVVLNGTLMGAVFQLSLLEQDLNEPLVLIACRFATRRACELWSRWHSTKALKLHDLQSPNSVMRRLRRPTEMRVMGEHESAYEN